MNDYCYKPKTSSLPKLNLTTLSTKYKSFYSNSKSKSTSSNYNTFRIQSTNHNTSNFSKSNLKEIDKIYSLTARKIIDEKIKKKKKKKLKKNMIYLTEISKNQTDDNYFAMSSVNKIDASIKKRINKDLIWKEKNQNIYDIYTSKNRIDINNVKNRVRENLSGVNINLRKEVNKNNYFPSDNIEIIKEAREILKRMQKHIIQEKLVTKKYNQFNRVDLHTFREHNRDICLNNILINIIKSESNKMKKNENLKSQALKEANDDFDKDTEIFEKLTKNEIINFRNKEIKLDEAIKQNRVLIDEIRKRNSELHSIKEEVKKYIRDILAYIKYENFIKKIISSEKDNLYENNNEKDNKDIIKFKYILDDKELDLLIKNIIKEYYIGNEIILADDITPQMVVNLLQGMQSNIINVMEERDLIIKEIEKDRKKYEKILEDLRAKVEHDKKELNILYKEINLVYNLTTPQKDMKEVKECSENYIISINKELSKYIKDKNFIKSENVCVDTFRLLHILQDNFYNIYNELNQLTENEENENIFKDAVEKIKIENKKEKQNEKKSLAKKLFEEKNKKLQQRMFRYKTKGPITVPPPWALNQRKKKKIIKRDIKAENEEILFY